MHKSTKILDFNCSTINEWILQRLSSFAQYSRIREDNCQTVKFIICKVGLPLRHRFLSQQILYILHAFDRVTRQNIYICKCFLIIYDINNKIDIQCCMNTSDHVKLFFSMRIKTISWVIVLLSHSLPMLTIYDICTCKALKQP